MALHVSTIHDCPDVIALRISGTAEERLLLMLIDGLQVAADGKRRLVLELDELVIVSARAIRAFIAHLFERLDGERVVLCCGRRTGRQVLRRWGGSDLSIASGVDDVLGVCSHEPSFA